MSRVNTNIAARDEIVKALVAYTSGTDIVVEYDNMAAPGQKDVGASKNNLEQGNPVRLVLGITMAAADQQTLGEPGNRTFNRYGFMRIAVLCPLADGSDQSDTIAGEVVDIFEGKDLNGLWFRNVSQVDIGTDGGNWRVDVTADFEFSKVK